MTAPDHSVPEGGFTLSTLSDLQALDEAKIKQQLQQPAVDVLEQIKAALSENLLGGIADALRGIFTPGGPFQQVSEGAVDGQRAIKDLVSRLSPLEEYASAFMPSTEGVWQGGRLPFTEVLVGSQGATPDGGSFVLNDYGMWRIDCQIWPSNYVVGSLSQVDWEVRVLRPDGSVYHRKRSRHIDTDSLPDKLTTTVVVPAAGYSVEVQVTSIAPLRGMRGGADRTHLTVHHINRITSGSGQTGETG